ncbi:MAG: TIGR03936 family radical SAM-associated protein [Clostridia bacterium]|nr:TIGR03936 family radical SAM-associated protein [Clostridia bacterium]
MSGLDFYARYEKKGVAKYVSHLDMVRMFNRVFRRGGIPIAYSEGFNPHPKISFALPLPVFFESECEMLIFALSEPMETDELLKRFNAVCPEGLKVTGVFEGKANVKDLSFARYFVKVNAPTSEQIDAFLKLDEIVVPKKTKSGIKDMNIKNDIKSISIADGGLLTVVAAGSNANLKPDVVMNAMNKYIEDYEGKSAEYLRLEILNSQMEII